MATSQSLPEKEAPSAKKVAGIGGAGGGTLLVVVARLLPDGYWLRPLLLWAAPTASVTLTGVWIWVQGQVSGWAENRKQRNVVKEARATLEGALSNPATSTEHREKVRAELEALEMIEVSRRMSRVKDLLTPST
jgi:hypothetical protein